MFQEGMVAIILYFKFFRVVKAGTKCPLHCLTARWQTDSARWRRTPEGPASWASLGIPLIYNDAENECNLNLMLMPDFMK